MSGAIYYRQAATCVHGDYWLADVFARKSLSVPVLPVQLAYGARV